MVAEADAEDAAQQDRLAELVDNTSLETRPVALRQVGRCGPKWILRHPAERRRRTATATSFCVNWADPKTDEQIPLKRGDLICLFRRPSGTLVFRRAPVEDLLLLASSPVAAGAAALAL